ncbi:hypothetical protein LOK49_LG04G02492 [Camellia lanceoleosa]|uniref:Uncharacterized protein n=1 Tax=Camellia lanceoleosa TaxID=1840588 RepID=A0ACC0I597_9ERIC|nr:hypothetical protein LOK49_LG04G02492 [Camellia lanceoleosa]
MQFRLAMASEEIDSEIAAAADRTDAAFPPFFLPPLLMSLLADTLPSTCCRNFLLLFLLDRPTSGLEVPPTESIHWLSDALGAGSRESDSERNESGTIDREEFTIGSG